MTYQKTKPGYLENRAGQRIPLSHNLAHVNRFVHSDNVRFEDLQKLAIDLSQELSEVRQVASDASDLIDQFKKLNYRQLLSVRKSLCQVLREKDDEPRVDLWMISDESDDIACYTSDQYQQACDKMVSLILDEAKSNPDSSMQFHLEKRKVRASEVNSFMEINDSDYQ